MSYVLEHWSAAWAGLAVWAVVAAMHLAGLRLLLRPGAEPAAGVQARRLAREAAAFQAGLLVALLALISPLGYWGGLYIWVRSLQDLLLALVAPGLIVLGAPWPVLASLLRHPARVSTVARPGVQDRPPRRPVLPDADQHQPPARHWWLAWPVSCVVAFNVVWLGWHIPVLFDLAARNAGVRYLEYGCYLAAGMLFWLQLIGSRPSRPVLPPLRRLTLVIFTAAADGVLGMVLVFGAGLLYPAYVGPHHHALSVVADQQVAGAVLWMGVLPPLIVVTVALINKWLDAEESDELSRDLDRVMRLTAATPAAAAVPGPGKPVWHARSGYRRPTI